LPATTTTRQPPTTVPRRLDSSALKLALRGTWGVLPYLRLCVKRESGAKIGLFREAATMAGKKRRRPSGLRPYLLALGEPPCSRETTATQTVWGRVWGKSKKARNPLPPNGAERRLTRKQAQNGRGGVPEVHHKKLPSARPPSRGPEALRLPATSHCLFVFRAPRTRCERPNRYLRRYLITIKPLEKLVINAASLARD
jgi:hypothetical protein